jgi:hypothetical protein
MPVFCRVCNASNTRADTSCAECGALLAIPSAARRRPTSQRAPAASTTTSVRPHGRRRRPRSRSSGSIVVWSVAGLALALAAGIGFVFLQRQQEAAAAAPPYRPTVSTGRPAPAAAPTPPAPAAATPTPLRRRSTPRDYEAMFHLRVESTAALRQLPLLELFGQFMRFLQSTREEQLLALGSHLRYPLEADVVFTGPQTLGLVLRMPGNERRILPWLEECSSQRPEARSCDGGEIGYLSLEPLFSTFEAVIGNEAHCLIVFGKGHRVDEWLDAHFGGRPRWTPREQQLMDRPRDGEARFLFSLAALLRTSSEEIRSEVVSLLALLVEPQWTGWSGSLRLENDRLVIDGHSDLRSTSGAVGALLGASETPDLVRWLPDDAREFACLSLDVGAATRLLRMPMVRQAVDDDQGLDRLIGILDGHWDGHLACVGTPTTAAEALDPDATGPFVLMFGVHDGPASLRSIPEELTIPTAEPTLEVDAPTLVIGTGGEPMATLVALPEVLLACPPDRESGRILLDCLATGGRGGLPRAFRERVGGALPPDCDVLVLSTVLGDYAGRRALQANRHGSKALPGFAELLEKALGASSYASWAVVDRDGTRMRIHY